MPNVCVYLPPGDAAPTSVKFLFFVKTPPPPRFMYANYFVVAVLPKYIASKSESKNISANQSMFLLI